MVVIKLLSTEKATFENFKRELNKEDIPIYEIEAVVNSLKRLLKLTTKKANICLELSQVWESDNEDRLLQHKTYLSALNDSMMYEKMLNVAEQFLQSQLNKHIFTI